MTDLKPCPFCGSPAHVVWNARRKIYPPSKGIDAGECVGACAYCENCNAQIFTTATHLIEEHHFVNFPDYPGGATVECTECAVGMMMRTVEEVVEAWNRRVQDEPQA